ncbi:MAG: hypothetical protein KGL95_11185 [Patescibacteria group bacterium]|nr:hypothetical protein [Patescibacteria group bacterium]
MSKSTTWILVVVALLVGAFGGYSFEKSKLTSQMMMSNSAFQKQMQDLQMKYDTLMKSQNGTMMKATPAPTGAMMEK